MITVSELEDAKPDRLEVSAQRARSVAEELTRKANQATRASTALGTVWYGPDADTAVANLRAHHIDLVQARLAYGRIDAALSDFAGEVRSAQALLKSALQRANGIHATVSDDGVVRVGESVMKAHPDEAALKRQISEIADDVAKARSKASAADGLAAAALRGTVIPETPDVDAKPLLRNVPGDPKQVDAWWDGLTPAQRLTLITADPKRIGALDGVPAIDRDQANRLLLDRQQETVDASLGPKKERFEEIEKLGQAGKGSPATLHEGLKLKDEIAALNEQADKLAFFERKLNEDRPAITTERKFLLKFDPAGDGRVIVAVGNPDTADNVATFVPGTEVAFDHNSLAFDRYVFNAGAIMQGDAARQDPNASTSVITWLDYEAPSFFKPGDTVPYVKEPSTTTALGLARFQTGLRATHEGKPSHNTVLGHSFGGTTVGFVADKVGLDVDNIVFVAAPGSGQGLFGDAGDFKPGLGQDGQRRVPRVFATVAKNDPISTVAGFGQGADLPAPVPLPVRLSTNGADPTEPGYGATVFRSDPGPDSIANFNVHESYWDGYNSPGEHKLLPGNDNPGQVNQFRDNFAKITTGRADQVTIAQS